MFAEFLLIKSSASKLFRRLLFFLLISFLIILYGLFFTFLFFFFFFFFFAHHRHPASSPTPPHYNNIATLASPFSTIKKNATTFHRNAGSEVCGWGGVARQQKGGRGMDGTTDNGKNFVSVNTSMSYRTKRYNDSLIDLIIKKSNAQEIYMLVGLVSHFGNTQSTAKVGGEENEYCPLLFFVGYGWGFFFTLDITNNIRFFIYGPIVQEQQKNYVLI